MSDVRRSTAQERRYRNENDTELAVLVPPLDLSMAPDSLYLVIVPNVDVSDGRIVSIRPTAVLCEIRNHAFKPFRVKIPLAPDQESPLTPPPEPLPEPPAGTPIPME